MKLHQFIGLAAILWLTGCANIAPKTDGSTLPTTPSTASTTAPKAAAEYPLGRLRPITAAEASSRGVAQLAPPADLWERIRRGFAMPDLESDLVVDREQWYATRPDYIQR
ncbi:MAG: Lytic transglycosylase, catalytic, partial [Rhodoferax sp.]|nr:Lytic transglycosylase, catalytic [Rhodoferax sp.]